MFKSTESNFVQQHADRKAILQINYSGNFDEEGNRAMF